MQVTHVQDHVSHAVIGNQKARDFGISNSAEFFNILSNTLYSDKKLAVVREVLCNAWDIHIQTGKTDKPVEVTLEDGKLIIRDFGTGISDDDIHPIYAVYGNSTKKLDGKQTGGFGLGSKAPFAYVDHFEVTSIYKGTKTIYAVSKSSAEVAGKPSITPLVSIASIEESGLMVSLQVKPEDRNAFRSIIQTIARFGEMNVKFNGDILPTYPFSQAKHGFLMVKDTSGISGSNNHHIFVRYGNVVYPVPDHVNYSHIYHRITKLCDKISNSHYGYYADKWKIIFQAKPDTISVTPSRESLSMTDHTIDSIESLLESFNIITGKDLMNSCVKIEYKAIETLWQTGRKSDLLTSNNKLPELFDPVNSKKIIKEPDFLTDTDSMGQALMSRHYPDFDGFRKKDIQMRLTKLEQNSYGGKYNRGKIQSFRAEYSTAWKTPRSASNWFQRVLVQPLIRKLNAEEGLSGSKLLVYGKHVDNSQDKNGRYRSYGESVRFVEASKLSRRLIEDYMPFLRGFVVLSYNRLDVEERLYSFPIMKEKHGLDKEFFVYIVSRTDKKIDIVRNFFANLGIEVVDLTKRGDHEPKHVLEPVVKPAVSKPRKKGLPTLASILEGDKIIHTRLKPDSIVYDSLPRTETPQFIVKINPRANNYQFGYGMDRATELGIIELYGDIGGIVVNDNQLQRFTGELKIPALDKWIFPKLIEEMENNQRIRTSLNIRSSALYKHFKTSGTHDQIKMFKTIVNNPELAIEFNILNEMTKKDKVLVQIIEYYAQDRYGYHGSAECTRLKNMVLDLKPEPEFIILADKILNSKNLSLLDTSEYDEVFSENAPSTRKKQRASALDLLVYAIEG